MTLAVVQGAGDDCDGAVRLETDATHFVARVGCHLQIVTNAAATNQTARAAVGLACGVAIPISRTECLVQHDWKLAAVIQHPGRRAIWHLHGLDMIAPAQFQAVDAHLPRRGLDQTLHVVIALRPSRTAVGADRSGVGEQALRRYFDQRRGIDADDVLHHVHRRRDGCRIAQPRAEVAVARHPQCQEFSRLIQCQFSGHLMIAPMAVGEKAFGSFVRPFYRTPKRSRGMQQTDILRIGGSLHAERTADITGENAYFLHRNAKDAAEQIALSEHALAAEAQGQSIIPCVVFADRGTRLHRAYDDTVVAH